MPTREVAAQFDQISTVYDETRDPLDAETVDRVAEVLRQAGVASLLEVGVGTGRVAKPLLDRGILVTGLDASRGMLAKARGKGLVRLVRGSGYRLPFPTGAFDATLFVHVLHVLDDAPLAVREAARVARRSVFALVHPRREDGATPHPREDEPRRLIREVLAEEGYSVAPRSSPWAKERDILARIPPDSIQVIGEKDVTESLCSRIDRLAKRGHRNLLAVPPEALRRAVEVARERVGNRTVTYHRVEAMARWSPERWSEPVDSVPA